MSRILHYRSVRFRGTLVAADLKDIGLGYVSLTGKGVSPARAYFDLHDKYQTCRMSVDLDELRALIQELTVLEAELVSAIQGQKQ